MTGLIFCFDSNLLLKMKGAIKRRGCLVSRTFRLDDKDQIRGPLEFAGLHGSKVYVNGHPSAIIQMATMPFLMILLLI